MWVEGMADLTVVTAVVIPLRVVLPLTPVT